MNMIVTNNASATLQIWEPIYKHDQTFVAGAALVYPKGMILALNTTTGFYEPYDSGGINGLNLPSALLCMDVDASAGAGNFTQDILISGIVRQDQLGVSQTMTTPTSTDIVALQDYGIIAKPTNQLGELDNQ